MFGYNPVRAAHVHAGVARLSFVCLLLLASTQTAGAAIYSCNVSTTALDFGTYDTVVSAPLDSTATVTTQCDGSASSGRVSLSLSHGRSESYTPRRMKNRNGSLDYNLYRDAARTKILGDGSGSTVEVTFKPACPRSGQACDRNKTTVYGQIPAGQNVAPGVYTDTITATVTF